MRLLGIGLAMVLSSCLHSGALSGPSGAATGGLPPCTFDERCVSGSGELDGLVSVAVTSAVVFSAVAFTVYQRMKD